MRKVGVIVTVEDAPVNKRDLAEYIILLMEWDTQLKDKG